MTLTNGRREYGGPLHEARTVCMRVVVTGGAGFLGAHLCAHLLKRGDQVVCVDNLSTGRLRHLELFAGDPRFTFCHADVVRGLDVDGPVDAVAHLASPASPREVLAAPMALVAAGSTGTWQALGLAGRHRARFVLVSSGDVYGDPLVHPQHEAYRGNVDGSTARGLYDAVKRYGEALTTAHRRTRGTSTGIARVFATYGPWMRPSDGRLVAQFATQALAGRPITVYGDGRQTRSLCHVDDVVLGLAALIDKAEPGPVNLGAGEEHSVREVARLVRDVAASRSPIVFLPRRADEPQRRRPDIRRAAESLGWAPRIPLRQGLALTVAHFAHHYPGATGSPAVPGPVT
jgi:dTDP-glucose 4,6-dehydratase